MKSKQGIVFIAVLFAAVVLVGSYFAGYLPFAIVSGGFGYPTPYSVSTRDTSMTIGDRVVGAVYTYPESIIGDATSITVQLQTQRDSVTPETAPVACALYEDQSGTYTLIGYTESKTEIWYHAEVTFNFIDTGIVGMNFPPKLHPNTDYLIAVAANSPSIGDGGSWNRQMVDAHGGPIGQTTVTPNIYLMDITDFVYPTSFPSVHDMNPNYPGYNNYHFSTNIMCSYEYDDAAMSVSVSGPSAAVVNTPVAFTSTVTGGEPPYYYAWNFGDGSSSPDANPTHTYTIAGTYTVRCDVSDSGPGMAYAEYDITISPSVYTVTTTATNGYITLLPSGGQYSPGETVTATATANSGYTFSGWTGSITSQSNPLSFTVNNDMSLTANFAPDFTLDVTVSPSGTGTVTITPDQATYQNGDTVVLDAMPNAGYHFVSWSGDIADTTDPLSITMDSSKSITANFAENMADQYTLDVTVEGIGTVIKNPDKVTYNQGETVTLTAAVTESDYQFSHWSGDLSGTDNPKTVEIDGDTSITAHFTLPEVKEASTPGFELLLIVIGILGIAILKRRK